MNRRKFTQSLLMGVPMAMAASSVGLPKAQAMSCAEFGITITNPHGHALTVPMVDLFNFSEITYDIQGRSGHNHTVTLTKAAISELIEKGVVVLPSSRDLGHAHQLTLTLGPLQS